MEPSKTDTTNPNIGKTVNLIIHLVILFLVIGFCFYILMPFAIILTSSAIIAVSVYTPYNSLVKLFRGRRVMAAIVTTIAILCIIIVPGWLVTQSTLNGVEHFQKSYKEGDPLIPPPSETVKNWPTFTKPLIDFWQHASNNLQEVLMQHKDQLTELGKWLLPTLSDFGKNTIQFIISIFIANIFLVLSEPLIKSSLKIFEKISSTNSEEIANLITTTIRSVIKGILGVAAIQAGMAGIAFEIAGIPFAGLWTILCLMLSIFQIGSWPILISMSIYMFLVSDTLTAVFFSLWMAIVLATDNILTPILLGHRSPVPMLVVFLGAIGGFTAIGFLGLFLGAIVLSIGYKLFNLWLDSDTQNAN